MADVSGKRLKWGRWLFLFLIVIGYSVTWFIMAGQIGKFVDVWEANQKAAGIDLQYADRSVKGFPLNFELVYDDAVYAVPAQGFRWQGDQLRIHSRTWDFARMMMERGGKLTGYAPGASQVTTPNGVTFKTDLGKASSLSFAWNADGTPKSGSINVDTLSTDVLPPGEPKQSFGLTDFTMNASPLSDAGPAPAFTVTMGWTQIDLPQDALEDPSIPDMAKSLVAQPQDGLTFTLRNGGIYFLGNRVADAPLPMLGQ